MPTTPNVRRACGDPLVIVAPVPDHIVAYLCAVPGTERTDIGFLTSVHNSLHQHSRLTERQISAVENFIRRDRAWLAARNAGTVGLHLDGTPIPLAGCEAISRITLRRPVESATPNYIDQDPDPEGSESSQSVHSALGWWTNESTGEPISMVDGGFDRQVAAGCCIPDGIYNLEIGDRRTPVKFQVHAIRQSRNSPDLVGKRVVSYYDEGTQVWVMFAFVTDGPCGFRLWRRFYRWAQAADPDVRLRALHALSMIARGSALVEGRGLGPNSVYGPMEGHPFVCGGQPQGITGQYRISFDRLRMELRLAFTPSGARPGRQSSNPQPYRVRPTATYATPAPPVTIVSPVIMSEVNNSWPQ